MNQHQSKLTQLSRRAAGRPLALVCLACCLSVTLTACPGGKVEAPEVRVHEGELLSPRGKNFTYVNGDVSDAKTVAIDYLQGDVRGKKIRNLWINFMEGTVANGPVTINILKGNIIEGDGVTVNLLIGEDFSGKAKIGKRIEPPLKTD
ncbi:MAG: hypothetical protein NXI24_10970 [bacterium]|nr:hypothetical protein [bacterium]